MSTFEQLISFASKLPGFFAYRPYFDGEEVEVKELIFRLRETLNGEDVQYEVTLFIEEGKCVDGIIDARFDDGSVFQIDEEEKEYQEIVSYKDRISAAMNQI